MNEKDVYSILKTIFNIGYGIYPLVIDISLTLVFTILFLFTKLSLFDIFIKPENLLDSLVNFLGILIGFLLTAFSILLTFEPKNNSFASILRKSNEYKNLLSSFANTSFLLLLLTLLIIVLNKFSEINFIYQQIFNLMILFSLFRFFRCFYNLNGIIYLSN